MVESNYKIYTVTMQNKLARTQFAAGAMAMLGAVFAARFLDNGSRVKSNKFDFNTVSPNNF